MTDNDYIAEYIKEKHASLLGLDFVVWKIGYKAANFFRQIVEDIKTLNTDDLKKLMEHAEDKDDLEKEDESE